jgi:hypothetical protein
MKVVQRGRFITMSAYIKNSEKFQKNNLVMLFKILEKYEQVSSKSSKR